MLPKNQRIPRKSFALLLEGKVRKNDIFLLRFTQGKNKEPRFCFSILKKVAKNAVVRNKMRRVGYRLLEKYIPQIRPNVLAVFSFRKISENNEEINKNLKSIINDCLL